MVLERNEGQLRETEEGEPVRLGGAGRLCRRAVDRGECLEADSGPERRNIQHGGAPGGRY